MSPRLIGGKNNISVKDQSDSKKHISGKGAKESPKKVCVVLNDKLGGNKE